MEKAKKHQFYLAELCTNLLSERFNASQVRSCVKVEVAVLGFPSCALVGLQAKIMNTIFAFIIFASGQSSELCKVEVDILVHNSPPMVSVDVKQHLNAFRAERPFLPFSAFVSNVLFVGQHSLEVDPKASQMIYFVRLTAAPSNVRVTAGVAPARYLGMALSGMASR